MNSLNTDAFNRAINQLKEYKLKCVDDVIRAENFEEIKLIKDRIIVLNQEIIRYMEYIQGIEKIKKNEGPYGK